MRDKIEKTLENNLKIVEITHAYNDYPKNLGDLAVIGFDNYDEAYEYANKYSGEISLLKTRDGWHFWHNLGYRGNPLTCNDYLNDLGDDYSLMNRKDAINIFKLRMTEAINAFDGDFKDLDDIYKNYEETFEHIYCLNDDENVICYLETYYETVKDTMMSYHEDVYTYTIGVVFTK